MKRNRPAVLPRPERRPIIGVTPDDGFTSGGHPLPRYELKRAYADAVLQAGGLPVILPYAKGGDVIEDYLELVHGVVLTGGAFDVPPELYGELPREGLGELKPERSAFEMALLEGALDRDLPVLGICGGMQLINVAYGGTLYQDIAREARHAQSHQQEGDRKRPHHEVVVSPQTLLSASLGAGSCMVNSTHHQAIKRVGRDLVASAVAPDGLVEAIEDPKRAFVVGVQWHPELLVRSVPVNRNLYRALCSAAEARAKLAAG